MQFTRPVAYQEQGGQREEVEVAYAVRGEAYGFTVGSYDRTRELVIDPSIRATSLGGTGDYERAHGLAVDRLGNVYVVGFTDSTKFPGIGSMSEDSDPEGFSEAFIAKRDPALGDIIAATFLGGRFHEEINAITIDSTKNLYVAGSTASPDFPGIGRGSADRTPGEVEGAAEGFVAWLNANNLMLHRANFLGGSGSDVANAITLDNSGNVYVAGYTNSEDFPKAPAPDPDADRFLASDAAFVAKLNSDLSEILRARLLDGSASDVARAIIFNESQESVYVAGVTSSADFPGANTNSSADPAYEGFTEGFIALLSDNLTLLSATFLGGSGIDRIDAITLGALGAHPDTSAVLDTLYVAGLTTSSDFPGVNDESADMTPTPVGGFVSRLDLDLSHQRSTYLDGPAAAIAFQDRALYIAGQTSSSVFKGIRPGAADPTSDPNGEAFVVLLNSQLTQIHSGTFLGGSKFDSASAIAMDRLGNVYVAGFTLSQDFPGISKESAYRRLRGFADAFVAKLVTCAGHIATIVGTDGDDEIEGTDGSDIIHGLGGKDTLSGLGGNDIICGGAGNDPHLSGGAGVDYDDYIEGGAGKDALYGEEGDDELDGGQNNDICDGGSETFPLGGDTAVRCEDERDIP